MKFLQVATFMALSLSGVYGVPQMRSGNEITIKSRSLGNSDATLSGVSQSAENKEKRDIEVVSRPNGPAPPSKGDPHGPPKRSLVGLVKRPNGPAPPSKGDPSTPPKRDLGLVKRPNGPAPPSKGDPHGPPKRDVTEEATQNE
ncbi:unnamed protein product [Colletotrichum noveboracense]|uniref:Uncharacterized protein n=1 Tax=Colletotrichum noveboracense TaxID=2664923 RepID=A0A9W4RMA2_9PEZI|nr:hypothetical protein K456DRAFT_1725344 [Colletotrichum gloeosporioides 23]KAJ0268082.1 hypothetical protein COL940_013735 [Colletotrichum noveboracense]CAI0643821.1 unnamed protein product [Colletotrichum noveboracense]